MATIQPADNRLRYYFEEVTACEMCGATSELHKILGQRLNCSQGLNPKNKTGISVSVIKCKNCELIFSSPQPIPFDINDHYDIPPEVYWNSEVFEFHPDYFAAEINVIKEILPFREGLTALDVGAGLGKAMISLSEAGFDTFGFEPSKPFYEQAISKMNISPERLKFGMIEDIDYPENHFDFITFGAVLEHLYHPAESIEKAIRWLKPNGIIHIEVPYSKWLISRLVNKYYNLRGANCVTNLSPMHPPFHLYEFGIKSFEELGEKLNFTIERKEHHVCYVFLAPKFLHPIFRKYMEWTDSGMQLIVWLRKGV